MSVIRDQLLAAEEDSWLRLHDVIGKISDDQWAEAGCVGDWSPKDLVAHIGCWAAEAARQLECIRAGHPSRSPDVEEFNKQSHEACSALTVHEAIAMASAAHHRLREELEQVAPVALNAKTIQIIEECAQKHYDEHVAQLRAFIEREGT